MYGLAAQPELPAAWQLGAQRKKIGHGLVLISGCERKMDATSLDWGCGLRDRLTCRRYRPGQFLSHSRSTRDRPHDMLCGMVVMMMLMALTASAIPQPARDSSDRSKLCARIRKECGYRRREGIR